MTCEFDAVYFGELIRAEAADRGLSTRLASLAKAREGDGLDETEALLDAGTALGISTEIREAVTTAVEPLHEREVLAVAVAGTRDGMSTLKCSDHEAFLSLPEGRMTEIGALVKQLVARLISDEDRSAVTLPVGLGGSGGCACGDELPEDRPPGPLFLR